MKRSVLSEACIILLFVNAMPIIKKLSGWRTAITPRFKMLIVMQGTHHKQIKERRKKDEIFADSVISK